MSTVWRASVRSWSACGRPFAPTPIAIHYSAKANANLDVFQTIVAAGAGIDAVSGGEIWRARQAGCAAEEIVFAGVGKTAEEIDYAVSEGVGWINIENAAECALIQAAAARAGRCQRVGLRLNPDEMAATFAAIATGHASAKFGLSGRRHSRHPRRSGRITRAGIRGPAHPHRQPIGRGDRHGPGHRRRARAA